MTRHSRPLAVALISASTLAYEILLVRVFAIEQFHHFAYMAIGVAMLGFGAAGTLLALALPDRRRAEGWFTWAALLTPVALLASAALVLRVPLDATQLVWDAGAWPRLALVYLLLAAPFAVGASVVLLALTLEPERVGALYGAGFLGAGIGAGLALAILWIALPERALAAPALAAAAGAITVVPLAARRRIAAVVALAGLALDGTGVFGDPHPLFGVELHRVELGVELVVLLARHLLTPRPPDLGAFERHRPPMDKHAETHGLPSREGVLVDREGLGDALGVRRRRQDQGHADK